ncbi:hypothetical protein BKA62DRAFT_776174 [Auriculariales sp. MPI-PUGE-AT-0066]|nr:hypothetical protein BKA62DRAFT_776174 [Auriculariales sp. MPI-PUGE-AT-0066]
MAQPPVLPPRPHSPRRVERDTMSASSTVADEPTVLSDTDIARLGVTPVIESRRRGASEYDWTERPTRRRSLDDREDYPKHVPLSSTTTTKNRTPSSHSRSGSIGKRIRGGFNLVHGAGELLRGSMIGAVDSVSDTIAQRRRDTVRTRNNTGMSGAEVSETGRQQMRSGLVALRSSSP